MKKFKKLTALLLAGAMTMLLLASCNGGGGGGNPASFEQQVEDAFFSVYSKEVGMTTNDPEAKALAENPLIVSNRLMAISILIWKTKTTMFSQTSGQRSIKRRAS